MRSERKSVVQMLLTRLEQARAGYYGVAGVSFFGPFVCVCVLERKSARERERTRSFGEYSYISSSSSSQQFVLFFLENCKKERKENKTLLLCC